jgi:hypothetical protein
VIMACGRSRKRAWADQSPAMLREPAESETTEFWRVIAQPTIRDHEIGPITETRWGWRERSGALPGDLVELEAGVGQEEAAVSQLGAGDRRDPE